MPHVSVVVQKHGVNSEDVVLTLTSHSFHELSGEYTDGIDPAECRKGQLHTNGWFAIINFGSCLWSKHLS